MVDPGSTDARFSVRYTVPMTEEMDQKLQLILEKQHRNVSRNDLFRMALQEYIEAQEDVFGNHKHSNRALRKRLEQYDVKTTFYLQILLYMMAAGLATLIQAVTKDNRVQASDLIKSATEMALNEGFMLDQRIQAAQHDAIDEK